jgi:hypothetical protein
VIGVERLQKILRCVYISNCLDGQRPLSVALIGPSDGGKSQLLLSTRPQWARVLNDFSFGPLISLLDEAYDKGKGVKHVTVVVPDFNAVLAHRPTVATLTAAALLSLLAEGLSEIPGLDGESKLKIDKLKDIGITISLITGMTPAMFRAKRGKWRDTGLLRRIIPIYYHYTPSTISEIQLAIASGADKVSYESDYYSYPSRRVKVHLNGKHSASIQNIANLTLAQLQWSYVDPRSGANHQNKGQELPFSVHKVFRVYARAHALLHSREEVNDDDMQAVSDLSRFTRYDRPEEI